MRRRLLISTLGVAVVSVILLGIPLGIVTTRLIRAEAQKRINAEAAAGGRCRQWGNGCVGGRHR